MNIKGRIWAKGTRITANTRVKKGALWSEIEMNPRERWQKKWAVILQDWNQQTNPTTNGKKAVNLQIKQTRRGTNKQSNQHQRPPKTTCQRTGPILARSPSMVAAMKTFEGLSTEPMMPWCIILITMLCSTCTLDDYSQGSCLPIRWD